jgi:serine kinase of HPr protein (carbohydrate metabolism regulator)
MDRSTHNPLLLTMPTEITAKGILLMGHAAVLVTGMSGVGKSTVLAELTQRGFTTVDTDYGPWIHVEEGEPLWREPMIHALLDRPRETPLFVQGTVANQGLFYRRFDAIVLLN